MSLSVGVWFAIVNLLLLDEYYEEMGKEFRVTLKMLKVDTYKLTLRLFKI